MNIKRDLLERFLPLACGGGGHIEIAVEPDGHFGRIRLSLQYGPRDLIRDNLSCWITFCPVKIQGGLFKPFFCKSQSYATFEAPGTPVIPDREFPWNINAADQRIQTVDRVGL